jgi:hypothetical protein
LQSKSTAIHADDIAYTLSEDRLLHPLQDQDDVSGYVVYYCWFGYFLLMAWMMHTIVSNNMKVLKSLTTTILEHIDFVLSAVFVGYLFIICEFIATTVYLRDLYSFTFHLYIWGPSLIGFIFVFLKVMHVCYKKCNKQSTLSDSVKLLITIFVIGILLFLIHIYCYALPTFLLLLVYPTKIITVVAYLTTFIFVTSIISSISIHLIIVFYNNFRKVGCCTSVMMFINAIFIFLHPFLMFIIMIQFLYVLVLGEASAISAGPYTVLSLIPTAAISAAGWLVKNKVFSSIDEEEEDNSQLQENEENEESAANNHANDSEALTLVVNEDTPRDKEVKSYGATGNN